MRMLASHTPRIVLTASFLVMMTSSTSAYACTQSGAPAITAAAASTMIQGDPTGWVVYPVLNTCTDGESISSIRFSLNAAFYRYAPLAAQTPPAGWTVILNGGLNQLTFTKDATATNPIPPGASLPFTIVFQGTGNPPFLNNEDAEYADNFITRARITYTDNKKTTFNNPDGIGRCRPAVDCVGPPPWGWLFHGLKIISNVAAPSIVMVGANLDVTLTVENRMSVTQANGVSATQVPSDPFLVSLLSAPAPVDIPAGTSAALVTTYQAVAVGTNLTFTGSVSGTAAGSANTLSAMPVVSNAVTIIAQIRPIEWREIY